MSEQGRKQEDRPALKSSRSTTSIPPQLGATPSLIPYTITPPDYTPHHIYGMIRPAPGLGIAPQMAPPISAKSCITNDMGPPIFMPSLNLGIPKSTPTSLPSTAISSSTGCSTASVTAAPLAMSMSDIILSNSPSVTPYHTIHPFYQGVRPGQPPYMSIPAAPPQSSMAGSKRSSTQLSSASTIAKPTPVPAGHTHKVGGYVKTHPGHQQNKNISTTSNKSTAATPSSTASSSSPSSTSSSSSTPVSLSSTFSSGAGVIKQSSTRQSQPSSLPLHISQQQPQKNYTQGKQQKVYPNTPPDTESLTTVFYPPMGHVISVPYQAMIPAHGLGGALTSPHSVPHSVASSTLTELLAPSSVLTQQQQQQQQQREQREAVGGGGGKQGKMLDVSTRPYSPGQHPPSMSRHGSSAGGHSSGRERSASGDSTGSMKLAAQTVSSQTLSHSTSGQATSTATHADTRIERPTQPSSASAPQQSQLNTAHNSSSSYQGPHRDRSNSSEMSNIIISMPGLTGRHIAAISGNQPPSYPNGSPPQSMDLYRGSRIKSEYGGGGGQVMDSSPVTLPHPTAMHVVPQSTTHVVGGNSGVMKLPKQSVPTFGQLAASHSPSSLPPPLVNPSSSSSSSSASGVSSPGGPLVNSVPLSGSPSSSLSPSRRPGIIRKRPHEGSWKVDNASSPTTSTLINKLPSSSSGQHAQTLPSPGSTPGEHAGQNSTLPSHPLSPGSSASSEILANHLGALRSENSVGDILPSPRKKRRKQDVIVTDDQYATNVPNNIKPNAVISDDEKLHPSQPAQSTMVTRARERAEEMNHREERAPPAVPEKEKVEIRYLSQLRQPQWPINGMYRVHHRAAHNHFKRPADIKHIEEERVSASSIANDKTSASRATGWKVHHLDPQLEDVLQVEERILDTMKKLEESVSNLAQCSSCKLSSEVLTGFKGLVEGNICRSTRIISHIETTRTKMLKVLEHKPTVLDLLQKYSTKHTSPTNSVSHKLRT